MPALLPGLAKKTGLFTSTFLNSIIPSGKAQIEGPAFERHPDGQRIWPDVLACLFKLLTTRDRMYKINLL